MESIVQNNTTVPGGNFNDLLVAKVASMCILGLASFFIGILPIKLTQLISLKSVNGNKNLLISLLLCFGGGVLLFTTFIHLQPEVREAFAHLQAISVIPDFGHTVPLSELVFCIGFFLVYLIEELVHVYLDHKVHKSTALSRSFSLRCSRNKNHENLTIPRITMSKLDVGTIKYISNSKKDLLTSQSTINVDNVSNESAASHNHHHLDDSVRNSFSGFLAVLALSFHAVFEGLAVGLEGSVEKVWYLFTAIATHKLVIAFCVGIELVTSKTKLVLVILYIGTFAIVTPLGIGAGIILSKSASGNQDDVITVVLQGLAAGTLLYVVFFEVLSRERDNGHNGIWQLLAIIAGFGLMFLLQILTGHEHHHHDDQHHHHHDHDADDFSLHHDHTHFH